MGKNFNPRTENIPHFDISYIDYLVDKVFFSFGCFGSSVGWFYPWKITSLESFYVKT